MNQLATKVKAKENMQTRSQQAVPLGIPAKKQQKYIQKAIDFSISVPQLPEIMNSG